MRVGSVRSDRDLLRSGDWPEAVRTVRAPRERKAGHSQAQERSLGDPTLPAPPPQAPEVAQADSI